MRTLALTAVGTGLLLLVPGISRAAACNPSGCLDAMTNAGVVVNDIFRDAVGRAGTEVPSYGAIYNVYPACIMPTSAGCAGQDLPPYDCPGQYTCMGLPPTFANVSSYINALDRRFWNSCRLATSTPVGGCPTAGCIADGTPGNYNPWDGMVFDLGASANQVAVFASNDHGPSPCESIEVTVYFTSNPGSRDVIVNPAVAGADQTRWNRGVLKRVFTKGWIEIRPPDPAGHGPACGDTASYSVETDSMVTVFALPPGAAMRYAAVIAGNDGIDFPACTYDSNEAELDGVTGLTASGRGICPGEVSGVEGATSLAWAANKQDLSWSPLNGALNFNVYRGVRTAPWTYDHTCFSSVSGSSTVSDPSAPGSPGGVFYYLVSARNAQDCPGEDAESLLGRDSSGASIPNPFPCP